MIDATLNPIVSENHDINSIYIEQSAVDGALSSLGRVWDAAEMGISQAEAERRIAAAQTPEAREQVLRDLKERAIRRAGLDTTGGRVNVVVAGKPAWYRLGVNVRDALNADDAMAMSHLKDWWPQVIPAEWTDRAGNVHQSKDSFLILRSDTEEQIGKCGNRYQGLRHEQIFGFLDKVRGEFGAHYEVAGSLHGGREVFVTMRLPEQRFAVNGVDSVEPYCVFFNPHTGEGAAKCVPSTVRAECANTTALAIRQAGGRGIRIRHDGNIDQRVEDARMALGLAIRGVETYREQAEQMAATPLSPLPYFEGILDTVLEVTRADALKGADVLAAAIATTQAERDLAAKRFQRQIDKRRSILEDIVERYEAERNGIGGMRGTAWSAYNAVTDHTSHYQYRQRGSEETRRSNRFVSQLTGELDTMNQTALTMALAR